jgi:release factor glutamine methyltransferase
MTGVPVTLREDDEAALVARLRAAGCVWAEDEAAVLRDSASSAAELDAMAGRRVAGEPLELVVGWAELGGVRVAVGPGVFVPRRRSELLARAAVDAARSGDVVVDLCCGSGALGAVVASRVPGVEVWAVDVEPAAVACAARNLAAAGGRAVLGDLDAPLPERLAGRVAVIVCNAPYVPTDEVAFLPAEARLFEPRVTLDGGSDGLDVQRRVAAVAPRWLAPGGTLLIETSTRQAPATRAAFEAAGLVGVRVVTDDDLDATVVTGRRRTVSPGSLDS